MTIRYDAETPPKAAVLNDKKSSVSSNAAIAQAGMLTGMGKSISCADGLLKISEKIRPLRIESLPWNALLTFELD